jgi:thiol:disulfide interchange protein
MSVDKLRRWLAQLRQDWKSHLGTLLMFLVLYAGIHAWQTRSVPSGVTPTFSAPAAGPQAGSGTVVDFASWRASHPGQAVALHFWADWCPICRTEENSVSRISRDWPVLSVAMQSGDAARVQGVLSRRQLDWHTAIDADGQIAKRFGLASVPALVVVDAHGQIRFAEVGYTSEVGMRLRLWWAQTF